MRVRYSEESRTLAHLPANVLTEFEIVAHKSTYL